MTLCIEKRGEIVNQSYLTSDRVELVFNMPFLKSFLIFMID
jgi:GTP-binding protein LepA